MIPDKLQRRLKRILDALQENEIPADAVTMLVFQMMIGSWRATTSDQKVVQAFDECSKSLQDDMAKMMSEEKDEEMKKLFNQKDVPVV